jgi:hypothetical protein
MTDTGYLYEYFLANSPKEEKPEEPEGEIEDEQAREAG